jgi:DNA-binding XRE family transcriptional regulator
MMVQGIQRRFLHNLWGMCKSLYMSELPAEREVPRWDTADRMRKALREADIGVQEMAAYLGVARNTVSTWINGRIEPSTQTLRLWALRCGVSYEWLVDDGRGGGLPIRFPSQRGGSRTRGKGVKITNKSTPRHLRLVA